MKRIGSYLLIFLLCFLGSKNVSATTYYLPDTHTYYQRSQHTYSFLRNDVLRSRYHPAVYTIIQNEEQAKDVGVWDFFASYKFPWTPTEQNYFVVYCTDLLTNIKTMSSYNRVDLKNSTFVADEAKEYIKGILEHSYPYITEEEMIKELVDAKALVSVKTEKGTYITAKTNTQPTRSVNSDELLAATQLSIYQYSNPSLVQKLYTQTEVLKGYTVTRRAGIWKNTYETTDYYDEVNNNIQAIYDYLIKQKSTVYDPIGINSIIANENNELFISLTNEDDNTDNLKFNISQNDTKTSEYQMKELKKDEYGNYIVPLSKDANLSNLKITVSGSVYKEKEAYVFEATEGKEVSQTMVGLLSTDMPIQTDYNGEITTFSSKDFSIEKMVSKNLLSHGEEFTYTIKAKNLSDIEIPNAKVTDEMNTNLEIVQTDGDIYNNKVTWNLNFKPHEEKILKITVKAKENASESVIENVSSFNVYNMEKQSKVQVTIMENPFTGQKFIFIFLISIVLIGVGLTWVLVKKKKI